MKNVDHLVELFKKIFPDEEITDETMHRHLRRLAIREIRSNDEPVSPAQATEENQGSGYTSEKIAPKPSLKNKLVEPYATFKKMRKLDKCYRSSGSYYLDNAENFYKQALFMQDFTDNCSQIVPADNFNTTYRTMNDAQLRTYFTWRTKARQGIVEDVSPSYGLCYIFELMNDIGVSSPDDAIEKMIATWVSFRQFNNSMDRYLSTWIRDYYVAHKPQIAAAFSEYSSRFPVAYYSDDIALLERITSSGWNDLHVIEVCSSFKITNGQFYKAGNQQMIEQCACFTIQAIAKLFKSGGVDFQKLFFEKRKEKFYTLYQGAVHRNVDISSLVVELSAFETIKCNRQGWCREYVSMAQYRPVVGYILKMIEVKMRQSFGYKRNLQVPHRSAAENGFLNSEPQKNSWSGRPTWSDLKVWKRKAFSIISSDGFETTIDRAISDYCKKEHIVIHNGTVVVVKPVEIDMNKLKEIERDYITTAEKLILEELPIPPVSLPVSVPVSAVGISEIKGMSSLCDSLPADGKHLLKTLLEGGQAPPNSELLIETINKTALEAIEDNLIDYAEGMPYLYDDYINDLRSALGGQ